MCETECVLGDDFGSCSLEARLQEACGSLPGEGRTVGIVGMRFHIITESVGGFGVEVNFDSLSIFGRGAAQLLDVVLSGPGILSPLGDTTAVKRGLSSTLWE